MNTPRATPSTTEVATEVNGLLAGLGILTVALFPFALPGLLFVVVPLALLALVGALLAMPVVLALWLVRTLRRNRAGLSRDGAAQAPARSAHRGRPTRRRAARAGG
jgi:hypothetical protein